MKTATATATDRPKCFCIYRLKCSKSIRKDGSAVQIIDKYPFGVNELTFEGFVSVGCLPFARLPVRFLKVWKVSS